MPTPPSANPAATLPRLIQGGMGVGVSNWRLARAVSTEGALGVVSGTALDTVVVRRLQDGDPGGHVREALAAFPIPDAADAILDRYFRPEGRPPGTPYDVLPMYRRTVRRERALVTVASAFVEVWLARQGHANPVGINLLTKVQMPNLAVLYGAMLAGVDVVLMGAGIPREVPGALDRLARHEPATFRLDVEGAAASDTQDLVFDPADLWAPPADELQRPLFLPIVSSHSLATMLARKATGRVDGFIVEGPTAGGHNAPPRGAMTFNERGEPVYGARDVVDLDALAALGLPFWLAGGVGHPDRVREALAAGAAGVQVGTLFAYCDESGFTPDLKRAVLERAAAGDVDVRTDARVSPTGYPFKVVSWGETDEGPDERERICDLGGLRVAYREARGTLGYRCPAEPVEDYVRKGGAADDTEGRLCLCNALAAAIGQGQVREAGVEPALITSGDGLQSVGAFLGGREHYTAADVIGYLMAGA